MFYLNDKKSIANKLSRATTESAGYDVFLNEAISIQKGETKKVVVTLPVVVEKDYQAHLYLRSSVGIKRGLRLMKNGHGQSFLKLKGYGSDYAEEFISISGIRSFNVEVHNDGVDDFSAEKDERLFQLVVEGEPIPSVPIQFEDVIGDSLISHRMVEEKTGTGVLLTVCLNEDEKLGNRPRLLSLNKKVKVPARTFLKMSVINGSSVKLANGVGIIDADYYGNPSNDGNIMAMVYSEDTESNIREITLLFEVVPYDTLTDETEVKVKRIGGSQSTGL